MTFLDRKASSPAESGPIKRLFRWALPLILALLLLVGWGLQARGPRLMILMYHDFTTEETAPNNWCLPISRFREDLEWLTSHGYTFYLPSELAAGIPLEGKAVMLTFDDGYESNYLLAYPLLKEYGAKAVISVVAGLADQNAGGILTWEMCREMVDSGLVEIGSHTYDCHGEDTGGLVRRPGESQEDYADRVFPDLLKSIEVIEKEVGQRPVLLAYPSGKADAWCKQFVRDHFTMTVTTWQGPCWPRLGLYDLGRYNIALSVTPKKILKH